MCLDSVRCICSCCSQSVSATPGNVPHLQEGFFGSSIIRGIGSVNTGVLHIVNALFATVCTISYSECR